MPTVKACLQCSNELTDLSDSARLDVEVLLAWVLEKDRSYLYTWPDKELTATQLHSFQEALARRKNGEPIAHIMGEKEFWSLPFYTDNSTLIPRPETEVLVELTLSLLPDTPARILDLGTGTGAIALALASERRDCAFVAIDVSERAIALAKKNAQQLQLTNVDIQQSHWFANVTGLFDVIVSNPPYIDADDPHLQQGDLRFEPCSALVADDHGLADIKVIAMTSVNFLKPGAWLAVEHGWQQKGSVQRIFHEVGFSRVDTQKDFSGNDRVTFGQK